MGSEWSHSEHILRILVNKEPLDYLEEKKLEKEDTNKASWLPKRIKIGKRGHQ